MLTAAAAVFPLLIAIAVIYLLRLDRDKNIAFRLVQFITDDTTGKANTNSLGVVVALLVSTWVVYYETLAGRMSEWLLGLYLGLFVAGKLAGAAIVATQKVGEAKAQRPPEPAPAVSVRADTAKVES